MRPSRHGDSSTRPEQLGGDSTHSVHKIIKSILCETWTHITALKKLRPNQLDEKNWREFAKTRPSNHAHERDRIRTYEE